MFADYQLPQKGAVVRRLSRTRRKSSGSKLGSQTDAYDRMLKEVQDMEVEASVFDRVGRRGRSNSRSSLDGDDDVDDDDDDNDDDDDEHHNNHGNNGGLNQRRHKDGHNAENDDDEEEQSGASAASSDNSNERYEQEERPVKKVTRSELYKAKFREFCEERRDFGEWDRERARWRIHSQRDAETRLTLPRSRRLDAKTGGGSKYRNLAAPGGRSMWPKKGSLSEAFIKQRRSFESKEAMDSDRETGGESESDSEDEDWGQQGECS